MLTGATTLSAKRSPSEVKGLNRGVICLPQPPPATRTLAMGGGWGLAPPATRVSLWLQPACPAAANRHQEEGAEHDQDRCGARYAGIASGN